VSATCSILPTRIGPIENLHFRGNIGQYAHRPIQSYRARSDFGPPWICARSSAPVHLRRHSPSHLWRPQTEKTYCRANGKRDRRIYSRSVYAPLRRTSSYATIAVRPLPPKTLFEVARGFLCLPWLSLLGCLALRLPRRRSSCSGSDHR
jgi:hypothetical protein